MMTVTLAARTHLGTVRERNEDAFVVGSESFARVDACFIERTIAIDGARGLLLGIADGIGGHLAGEEASEYATDVLANESFDGRARLEDALHRIDRSLLERGRTPETYRLGTTFCGMIFGPEPVGVMIGDGLLGARIGRALRPLGPTWDDVAETNAIDSALGGREPARPLVIAWHELPMDRNARYVIASDGVVRALSYDVFSSALHEARSPSECVARIFDRALAHRAPDNITCIVAEVTTHE